ncbi:unnamed protein product [Gulo gulo]|uniref:Uncharacterized protein n=1 Tax=Gulo gulo TaxID=48420 RepID=A0A9X9Q075_GULGU|nr:unnamed protein product [Gulo gulo]
MLENFALVSSLAPGPAALSPDRLRSEASGPALRRMECTLLALSLAGTLYLGP